MLDLAPTYYFTMLHLQLLYPPGAHQPWSRRQTALLTYAVHEGRASSKGSHHSSSTVKWDTGLDVEGTYDISGWVKLQSQNEAQMAALLVYSCLCHQGKRAGRQSGGPQDRGE